MARFRVENVPDDLYRALREQARRNERSISAEVRALIEDWLATPEKYKKLLVASRRKAGGSPTQQSLKDRRAAL